MKTIFSTFPSGCGDCLFIVIKDEDGGSQYSIMTDCGSLTDDIKSYIRNELQMTIDMLIVTHIDGDHVNGVTKLLLDPNFVQLRIGKILFNCFQSQPNAERQPLDETTNALIKAMQRKLPPLEDRTTGKTNSPEAACLANAIMKNESWNAVWEKEQITTGYTVPLDKEKHYGDVFILSPDGQRLKDLVTVFKSEFKKWTRSEFPGYDVLNQEELFQQIITLANAKMMPKNNNKTNATINLLKDLQIAEAEKADEEGITKSNCASLSYACIVDGKIEVLVLGDAPSSDVLRGLEYYNIQTPIIVPVVKMSHHASKHNTNAEFVKKIDSPHWFITGGNKEDRPSLEAIAKVVMKPLKEGIQERTIHVNKPNIQTKRLTNATAAKIKEQYHFIITEDATL